MARKLNQTYRCHICDTKADIKPGARIECPECGSDWMDPVSLDRQAIEGRGETNTPEHFANPRGK